MNKKTEIKKIVLGIDGKEIALTPDQAKKLQGLLNEMYGNPNTPVYVPTPMPSPIIIERSRPYWINDGYTWWSESGNTMYFSDIDNSAKLSL